MNYAVAALALTLFFATPTFAYIFNVCLVENPG
jgi:hypothetical protein